MSQVAIIMGSKSDFNIMKEAIDVLESFGVKLKYDIVSAHRTPKKMIEYATNAEKNGIKVIIAGAGGAAHLPGMVASITSLPVMEYLLNLETQLMAGIQFYQSFKCLEEFL
ncbi:MAG: hypothetical protein CM15mP102_07970 [Flavobacteriales bacterium]|nr:MAG: hypothetical protein CM15mP102_07970 [Flavobacteriales bacterium]